MFFLPSLQDHSWNALAQYPINQQDPSQTNPSLHQIQTFTRILCWRRTFFLPHRNNIADHRTFHSDVIFNTRIINTQKDYHPSFRVEREKNLQSFSLRREQLKTGTWILSWDQSHGTAREKVTAVGGAIPFCLTSSSVRTLYLTLVETVKPRP